MRCFRPISLLALFTLFLGDMSGGALASDESLSAIENLLKAGRYAEAEGAARQQLQAGGSDKADTVEAARIINLLVEAMVRGGEAKNPEARNLAERSVSTMERSYGRQSPETAESLSVLGRVSLMSGDYPGARDRFEEVLAIREKLLAPDD
ncbi:MAG TPA: tetratricopeptide repeat protein, partial [Gemmataceae bacterium]|nr:tetratricopeptide repeat protein [Gemmataceae bacterium]